MRWGWRGGGGGKGWCARGKVVGTGEGGERGHRRRGVNITHWTVWAAEATEDVSDSFSSCLFVSSVAFPLIG